MSTNQKFHKDKDEETKKEPAAEAGAKDPSPSKKKKQNKLCTAFMYATPKNIEEQRLFFFENDCKLNPQFEYDNYAMAQKFVQ